MSGDSHAPVPMIYYRSDFTISKVEPDKVFIVDLDNGSMSVTNDAENVVAYLYERFGDRRFIYCDTMKRWDELVHDHGKFLNFKPFQL